MAQQQRPHTVRRDVRIPDELIERARQAIGREDLSVPQLVRLGLATLAGVDVEPYTPQAGWPKGRRRTRATTESSPIAS
jgi:hypothetical protein